MTEKELKDLKIILDPRKATRVSFTTSPAAYVEKITRAFWVNHDRYQESKAFLKSYTDASNCKTTAPVETEYIVKPGIGRASVFPGKWVHSECAWIQQSGNLLQTLTRVYDITKNQDLWDRPAIPTYDNEILNALGLSTTETDGVAFVISALTKESRAYCLDSITDQQLVDQLTGEESGYVYQGRRFEVNAADNTAVFTVAFTKASSNAFLVTAPDIFWYINKTTKQEQFHQLWSKVNKDDPLTDLYTPTAGYNVTGVSIAEGEAGTLRIHRTQLIEGIGAQDAEYENRSTQTVNPHSFVSGTMNVIAVQNHHLKSVNSAYGTLNAADAGYTLVDVDKVEEGNGLWTKIYSYEKPVWTAWDKDATATNIQYHNLGKNSESFTQIWTGIRIANKNTAVSNCRLGTGTGTAAQSGFRINDAYAQDNNNGSITVTQKQILNPSAGFDPGGSRLDYDGIILKHRNYVSARISGGVDAKKLIIRSGYGQLFELADYDSEQQAAEVAWDWAEGTLSPHGATLVPVYDPSSGLLIGGKDGRVNYVGNGVWEAVRVCYENDDASHTVPQPDP